MGYIHNGLPAMVKVCLGSMWYALLRYGIPKLTWDAIYSLNRLLIALCKLYSFSDLFVIVVILIFFLLHSYGTAQ